MAKLDDYRAALKALNEAAYVALRMAPDAYNRGLLVTVATATDNLVDGLAPAVTK